MSIMRKVNTNTTYPRMVVMDRKKKGGKKKEKKLEEKIRNLLNRDGVKRSELFE